jgi:hypothetical protein
MDDKTIELISNFNRSTGFYISDIKFYLKHGKRQFVSELLQQELGICKEKVEEFLNWVDNEIN